MIITLLCKVLDNFGDIGTVYRLANRISFLLQNPLSSFFKPINNNTESRINLIVDDLQSFKKICPKVDVNSSLQKINDFFVYDWNDYELCYSSFCKDKVLELGFVVECFQCGRPSWMEKIFFEDKLDYTIQTIMIDYLSAEDYVENFHKLRSLTRSAKVQKVNFMPGFTQKTGGLILDQKWEMLPKRNKDGPILIFTYDKDWTSLVFALKEYMPSSQKKIIVASGAGLKSFCRDAKNILEYQKLDYLPQEQWDTLMQNCSVLFIRGEESLSRAVLSGFPFVWHAYRQTEDFQLVKVKALLKLMKNFFNKEDFSIIENVWLDFNTQEVIQTKEFKINMQKHVLSFLQAQDKLLYGFVAFSKEVRKSGDLASNLMTFIKNIDIIK